MCHCKLHRWPCSCAEKRRRNTCTHARARAHTHKCAVRIQHARTAAFEPNKKHEKVRTPQYWRPRRTQSNNHMLVHTGEKRSLQTRTRQKVTYRDDRGDKGDGYRYDPLKRVNESALGTKLRSRCRASNNSRCISQLQR